MVTFHEDIKNPRLHFLQLEKKKWRFFKKQVALLRTLNCRSFKLCNRILKLKFFQKNRKTNPVMEHYGILKSTRRSIIQQFPYSPSESHEENRKIMKNIVICSISPTFSRLPKLLTELKRLIAGFEIFFSYKSLIILNMYHHKWPFITISDHL